FLRPARPAMAASPGPWRLQKSMVADQLLREQRHLVPDLGEQQLHHQRNGAGVLARRGAAEDARTRIAMRKDRTFDLGEPVAHEGIVDPPDLPGEFDKLGELLAKAVGAADARALVLQRGAADVPALAPLADLPRHRGLGIVEKKFAECVLAALARHLA